MGRVGLSEETVRRFVRALRGGLVWSNGLVGSETLRYADGCYVREGMDMREPDVGPFVDTMSEDELESYLHRQRYPDFVQRSLLRRLGAWEARGLPETSTGGEMP